MFKKNKLTLNKTHWYLILQLMSILILGALVAFSSYSLLRLSLFDWDWNGYGNYLTTHRTFIFWLENGVIFLIFLWLASVIGSKWIAASAVTIASVGLAIANDQKMQFRGEPVYPSDMDMIKAIPSLTEMVDSSLIAVFVAVILVILMATILLARKEWLVSKKYKTKVFALCRIIGIVVLSFFMISLYNFNQPENKVRAVFEPHTNWMPWQQSKNYQGNGFVSGFLFNLNAPTIEEPENYSSSTIESIVSKYKEAAEEQNNVLADRSGRDANIIFVMNESFSDPDNLENLSLSESPIPYFNELTEQNRSGSVLTQSYGGGTANVEFEALTSISMEPLSPNITTPYIQMSDTMGSIPNIISDYKEKGYLATAIHPYNTTMYKRTDVYTSLGFDYFIHEDIMQSTMQYGNNANISDRAAYEEVLYQMEESEKKDIVHLVTMHNHTAYEGNYDEQVFSVDGMTENETAEQYYQGLSYSDQDLRFFIEQIDQMEEDTLVVFWGDHLPGIFPDELFSKKLMIDKFETPLLFYSNFDDKDFSEEVGIISPMYFTNHIAEILDQSISGFRAFMHELEKNLPAFKNGIYIDSNLEEAVSNRSELSEETRTLLEAYDLILYDLLEGNRQTVELGFFDNP